MLSNRNNQGYQTKSLTWWANEKPEVEDLLQSLLDRRGVRPATLSKKKGKDPIYLVTISYHEHGNAEDFHFGLFNKKNSSIKCALDLTRIAAHGRKQRLNCAMEEAREVPFEEMDDTDRLVQLKADEYKTLNEIVINKLQ